MSLLSTLARMLRRPDPLSTLVPTLQTATEQWDPDVTTIHFERSSPDTASHGAATARSAYRLWKMKAMLVRSLHDCGDDARERLTQAIYRCRNTQQLGLVRADVFQCIARLKGQQEAHRRVEAVQGTYGLGTPRVRPWR